MTSNEISGNVPKAYKLIGKVNYFEWRRHFDRAAKNKDLWKILSNAEKVLLEPEQTDFLIYTDGTRPRPPPDPKVKTPTDPVLPPGNGAKQVDGSLSFLNYQIAYNKYEKQQKKMTQIRALLLDSVTSAIQIELEDNGYMDQPLNAAQYLVNTYGVTNERAREQLLNKVNDLTLDQCASMTDFINKHRELKLDLTRAKMTTYTTATMVTHILAGLPHAYKSVKEQWDWIRAKDADTEPDLQFLQDRLLIKEIDIAKEKKRIADDKDRKGGGGSAGRVKGKGNGGNAKDNADADAICDWEPCGRKGHTSLNCWVKHPEKKPQHIKDREAKRKEEYNKKKEDKDKADKDDKGDKEDKKKKYVAMVQFDHDQFRKALDNAKKSQTSNLFTILDTPLGSKRTAAGMTHDLKQDDIETVKPTASFRYAKVDVTGAFHQGVIDKNNIAPTIAPKLQLEKKAFSIEQAPETFTPFARAITYGTSSLSQPPTNATDSPSQVVHHATVRGSVSGKWDLGGVPDGMSWIEQEHSLKNILVLLALAKVNNVHWSNILLDSGCNGHVFNKKSFFTEFTSFSYSIDTAAQTSTLAVEGGGTVIISLRDDDGDVVELTLTDVAYCPHALCNLVSLNLLGKKGGLHGSWNADAISIETKSGQNIGSAKAISGLYHLTTVDSTVNTNVAAVINFDDEIWKWHRRLGHLSWQSMRLLLKHSTGINLTDGQVKAMLKVICPICAVTKALVHIPREPAKRRAKTCGELIHVDGWGPYSIPGFDGTLRKLLFTDDCDRFTWSESYGKAGDMPDVFKKLHKKIEKSEDVVIRAYRFDGEFQIGEVASWLERKNVTIEPTVPYQHYMNGVAERGMRTVREKAAPMMQEAKMNGQITRIICAKGEEMLRNSSIPENLWTAAWDYGVWLKNRTPSRSFKDKKTPWEAHFKSKPTFGRERIWGSRAYVTLPPELGRDHALKIHDPRGWLGYFVGCESESIYLIYSEEKHRVFRVGVARVDDGEGLADPHDSPSMSDRLPELTSITPVENLSDDEEEEVVSSNEGLDGQTDVDDIDFGANGFSSDIEDDHQAFESDEELPDMSKDPQDNFRSSHAASEFDEEISGFDAESDDDSGVGETTSRFFAGMAGTVARNFDLAGDDIDPTTFPKCDQCFRAKSFCNGKRPCGHCCKYGRKCTTVTLESLNKFPSRATNLLLDQAAKAVVLADLDKDFITSLPKCRTCFLYYSNCDENQPCTMCRTQGYKCRPLTLADLEKHPKRAQNLVAATQMSRNRLTDQKSKEKERNPKGGCLLEDKCVPCYSAKRVCNGKLPCDQCVKRGHPYRCYLNKDKDKPKCRSCTNYHRYCDRQRPCTTCVRNKITCGYVDQDGLVLRQYNLSETIYEDDEECGVCRDKGRSCNGHQPCYRCVLHNKGRKNCVYKLAANGGVREAWKTTPYKIKDGEVFLPANWKEMIGTWKGKKPNHNDDAASDVSDSVQQQLNSDFPNGFILIETSGVGLLCGLRALRHSMMSQFPSLPAPAVAALEVIARTGSVAQAAREALEQIGERPDENNFTADHLMGVAQEYGRQHGWTLQLGVHHAGHDPLLIANDDEDAVTLWIHNNGAGHYEGMKKNDPSIPSKNEQPKNSAPHYSSDDDSSSNDSMQEQQLDDDVNHFMEQGSMNRQLSTSSPSEYRTVVMMTLADHRSLDDYDAVDGLEPTTYGQAMKMPDAVGWQGSVDREQQSLEKCHVYELIDIKAVPKARRCLTSRWVFKRKLGFDAIKNEYKRKYKARLVARGFQQVDGIDYEETFSAVVKAPSYRTLIALAAMFGHKIYLMDVKTAFLYGDIDVEIYVKPPPGFKCPKGKVLRLLKALYGLKQAPRLWYQKLATTLVNELGFRISPYDPCVFIHMTKALIVAIWVDDLMVIAKNKKDADDFRIKMSSLFEMVDEGECTFYLGMNMEQRNDGILIHQRRYLEMALTRFGYQDLPIRSVPMDPNVILETEKTAVAAPQDKALYASKIGSLNWMSNQTRIDISYSAGLLARFTSNPNRSHEDAMNDVWAYLNSHRDGGIYYRRGQESNWTELLGYSDSDYAMCPDTRRSTTGWVFLLAGAPISWCSQRQKSNSLSSTDAEWIAGAEGAREAVWLRRFVNDLRVMKHISAVTLMMDNNAVLKLSHNPELHKRTKHIDVRYHFLRERVMDVKDLYTERVDTSENIADALTKALGPKKFRYFMGKIGLVDMKDMDMEADDEKDDEDLGVWDKESP